MCVRMLWIFTVLTYFVRDLALRLVFLETGPMETNGGKIWLNVALIQESNL